MEVREFVATPEKEDPQLDDTIPLEEDYKDHQLDDTLPLEEDYEQNDEGETCNKSIYTNTHLR